MSRGRAPAPVGHSVSLRLGDEARGERIDVALARVAASAPAGSPLAGFSRSRLQKLVAAGVVFVSGEPVRASYRIEAELEVVVEVPPPAPLALEPEARPLAILFEDEHLIAIDKPAGLVVHPGAGRPAGTLVNALLAHCKDLSGIGGVERPGIVHRLDRDTSGVLVVAKHDRAHEALSRQFAAREVTKDYLAFVLGVPRPAEQRIETPFARHPTERRKFTGRVAAGRRALTSFRLVRAGGGLALLDVALGTGRTHQIRVHLSELGHPVVGDPLYGGKQPKRVRDVELRELVTALDRHALHAARLELRHPITREPIAFVAPLPAELARLDEAVRRLAR